MNKLAIVVGGGPAPGINSVIAAATIEAEKSGFEVLGIRDGFAWVMAGDTDHIERLTAAAVTPMHFRGGAMIGTGRANPTRKPEQLAATLASLQRLGADKLITIGGDDTAFTAMQLAASARASGVPLTVVHVPKTIDDDLDLPPYIETFGYETARQLAAELAENILRDADTMSRWFFIVAMGRKAGHLALGMGAAVGATVTVVAEEWPDGPIPLREVVDVIVGAMLKSQAAGRTSGVAVIAEGIVERLAPSDLDSLGNLLRDEHGNVRLGEIDIGDLFERQAAAVLGEMGIKRTIVTKEIGYELRCQDPSAHDKIYCRELGYCAARMAIEGFGDAMVAIDDGVLAPIPFEKMLDPATGRTRVRFVDTGSLRYRIARRYMVRLTRDDFADPAQLARLAGVAGMTGEALRTRFGYLADREQPLPAILLRE